MKRRTLALIVMFALVLTAVFALAACDDPTPTAKTYKVTFYNGTTKIKEVEIEEGKTIDANYKPESAGQTFVAWYEDVSLAGDPFDVTTPIKANIKLYARFRNDVAAADTREWYVVGSGSGDMSASAWAQTYTDGLKLTKADGKNEFTITLDMYAGDQIQFVYKNDTNYWENQHGVGYMEGYTVVEEEGGINGIVKVGEKTCFVSTGGYGPNPNGWNAVVAEGADATYKFTLVTDPDDMSSDVIKIEIVKTLEALDTTANLVIAGSLNDWQGNEEKGLPMEAKDVDGHGEGKWIYTFEVTEPIMFKAVNLVGGTWLGQGEGNNLQIGGLGGDFNISENGTWILEVDTVNKTYKLEKAAIRVVGTIDGQSWADGSQRGEGFKDNMYEMMKVESATEGVEKYELVLEITAAHKPTTWGEFNGAAALKVDFCACGYTIWDCGVNNSAENEEDKGINGSDNIIVPETGWYKVTLEISYNAEKERQTKVTVEKTADPVYVAKIGLAGYTTLANAVAMAKNGATIVLQDNIDLAAQLIVNKKITLDLNGKTITNTTDLWDKETSSYGLIAVIGGELTITGNGKMAPKANDGYSVSVWNGAKLTIENGEFNGNLHTIYVHKGSAVINGGKFDLQQLDSDKIAAGGNGYEFMLNLYDANGKNGTATISVTGGSFVEYDPSRSHSEAPEVSFVAEGYTVKSATVDGKTVYTVEAAPAAND